MPHLLITDPSVRREHMFENRPETCYNTDMEENIYLRYQYRIYPTDNQTEQIRVTADCCRFVHNYYLNARSLAWRTQHRNMNYNACANDLRYLKMVYPWLGGADSMALQEELKDLQRSFENFWRGDASYPQYRSRKASGLSYRTRNQKGSVRMSVDNKYIHLPRLGWTKIKLSRDIPGVIENATIIRRPSGKYFVSLTVKIETSHLLGTNKGQEHGLDLGIKSFYTLDDGTRADNIHALKRYESKLLRAQRRLSRMKKGSANFLKQKHKLARLHEKVADIRKDFLHKESAHLAKMCSLLCIEDLNVKGMVKNHHLAGAISDASWSEFVRMLEYKLPLHGGILIKVPRYFASTQVCHICGHKEPKAKVLSVREWTCPQCGAVHDRDDNAAINILAKGKAMLLLTA